MKATCENRPEEVCANIFKILVAQMIFLALWSLPAQTGLVFVPPYGFLGSDYFDFYRAAADWLHGINPYLRPRFFTPPPSLLAGMISLWLPFRAAKFFILALNFAIIVASIRACSRRLGLSKECTQYLTGITLLFYPTYFLLERGHLEGIILGCLCWAFCTKNNNLRAALVAIAGGLKVYPLLLILPAIWNRLWRFAFTTFLAFVLLMLPFYHLAQPFLHAVTGRAEMYQQWINISPAGIIVAVTGLHFGPWIFLTYWVGTLALMLYRQRSRTDDGIILPFLPWMVAFPMTVFPYGGVLLLPVLAWRLREMQGRKANLRDEVFIYGFLLVGIQACALTTYFRVPAMTHPIFDLMNSLGMCLILGSLAIPNLNGFPLGRQVAYAIPATGDD